MNGADDRLRQVLERWFESTLAGGTPDLQQLCGGDPALEQHAARLLATDPLAGEPPGHAALGAMLGEYRLLEVLGRGGMGTVWLAEQASLNRRVAIKILDRAALADPAARARFRREAELAASLEHPSIVPIHAVGEADGACYLAMKLLSGPSLDLATKPMPARRVAEIGMALASALDAAHLAGIVHRDVKPSNVLLDGGRPVLVDFGLARSVADATLTDAGTVPGTLCYLPPERLRADGSDRSLDPRGDVYSLGATLHELAGGERPFVADEPRQLIAAIADGRAGALRLPARDRDLATILARAMAVDPGRRFASAAEFGDELARFLAGAPIRSRRDGLVARCAGRMRRSPWLTAVALVALLAIGVAAAGQVRAAANERENRHQALVAATAAVDQRQWSRAIELLAPLRRGDVEIDRVRTTAVAARALDQVLTSLTAPAEASESAELELHAGELAASAGARLWPVQTQLVLALAEHFGRRSADAHVRIKGLPVAATNRPTAAVLGLLAPAEATADLPPPSGDPEDALIAAIALRGANRKAAQVLDELEAAKGLPAAVFFAATLAGESGDWRRASGMLEGLAAAGIDFPQLARARAHHAWLAGEDALLRRLLDSTPRDRWSSVLARIEIEATLAAADGPEEVQGGLARLQAHRQRWPESIALLRLEATVQARYGRDPQGALRALSTLRARADLSPTERDFTVADALLIEATMLPDADAIDDEASIDAHRRFVERWSADAAELSRPTAVGAATVCLARSRISIALADLRKGRADAARTAVLVAEALAAIERSAELWSQSSWPLLELANAAHLLARTDKYAPANAAESASFYALHGRALQRLLYRQRDRLVRLSPRQLASALAQACEYTLDTGDALNARSLFDRLQALGPAGSEPAAALSGRLQVLKASSR